MVVGGDGLSPRAPDDEGVEAGAGAMGLRVEAVTVPVSVAQAPRTDSCFAAGTLVRSAPGAAADR